MTSPSPLLLFSAKSKLRWRTKMISMTIFQKTKSLISTSTTLKSKVLPLSQSFGPMIQKRVPKDSASTTKTMQAYSRCKDISCTRPFRIWHNPAHKFSMISQMPILIFRMKLRIGSVWTSRYLMTKCLFQDQHITKLNTRPIMTLSEMRALLFSP